jgi:hypothetical protein
MSRRYYEECLSELESATTQDELLQTWHSFDFDQITQEERDDLSRNFCKLRDKIRGYSNKLDSDYDLANFCHGGDLDEDD